MTRRECERCGGIFNAKHNFKYCSHCEFKVQGLAELWDDTIDDLLVELKEALCEMFNTLDADMAYTRRVNTVTVLERAFKKINHYDYYDRQLSDIYSEVVEPTNQEIADRDQELMDNHYDMKLMEAKGK